MIKSTRISRTTALPSGCPHDSGAHGHRIDPELLPDALPCSPALRKSPLHWSGAAAPPPPPSGTQPWLLRLSDCVMYKILSGIAAGPGGLQRLARMERVCRGLHRSWVAPLVWNELCVRDFGDFAGGRSGAGTLASQKSLYRRLLSCRRELGDVLIGRDVGIAAEDVVIICETTVSSGGKHDDSSPLMIRREQRLNIQGDDDDAVFRFPIQEDISVPATRLNPASLYSDGQGGLANLHSALNFTYRVYVCDQRTSRGGEPRVANLLTSLPSGFELSSFGCRHNMLIVDTTSFDESAICASSMRNKCCVDVHSSADICLSYEVQPPNPPDSALAPSDSAREAGVEQADTRVKLRGCGLSFFLGCNGGHRQMTKREFLEGIEHCRWH